jgi:AcrR family transcriptional regulator
MDHKPARTPSGSSREKLLEAAIDLFGQRGFDGVSTREIAARAGVNISGIAYQFGGKEDLYLACTQHIAEIVRSRLAGPSDARPPDPATMSAAEAAAALRQMVSRFARFFLGAAELDRFARMVLREQMDPTPAFETLYGNTIAPMHQHLCMLWGRTTGQDPESEAVKLATFGIISQLMFFRFSRAAALRRLEWNAIGPEELEKIEAMVLHSLDIMLAAGAAGDVP